MIVFVGNNVEFIEVQPVRNYLSYLRKHPPISVTMRFPYRPGYHTMARMLERLPGLPESSEYKY